MRHEWEMVQPTQATFGFEPKRRCKICGAVQSKTSETNWGRVVRYQWWPLVGRCKGDKKEVQHEAQEEQAP